MPAISVNASGSTISPDPNVARDYSQPVQFTLSLPDGTKQVYTVTVKGADCITPAGKYTGVWIGSCVPSTGEAIGPTDHTIDKFTISPTSATTFTLAIDTVYYTNSTCNVVNGIRPTYVLNISILGNKAIAGGKTVDKVFYSRIGSSSFGRRRKHDAQERHPLAVHHHQIHRRNSDHDFARNQARSFDLLGLY